MDKTIELIRQAKAGDSHAREQVVEENLGLVWSVARRFLSRGYELEDLYQIGCIGLLKSIDKFDLQFQVKFSTYAVPMIMGEIKRFIRDDGMLKVSRSLKEMAYKAYIAREKILQETGIEPTIDELAEVMEAKKEELIMAMEASVGVESIYKTIYQQDGNAVYLVDKLTCNEDLGEGTINRLTLEELLNRLDGKEYEIIYRRYFREETQTEIARALGISQVQVSRIEKKVLMRLREEL